MEELINKGEVEVIKKSQKKNDKGIHRYWVRYQGEEYLTCTKCCKYLKLDKFCDRYTNNLLANKSVKCKNCASDIMIETYAKDFKTHLRHRYKHIESQSRKNNVPCLSFDEFIEFSKTERDPIYGYTLVQAFQENVSNKFDVEHKHPISQGGTSLKDNLTFSCKAFNMLKGIMNIEETIEMAKLIVKNEENIRKKYS